MSSKYVMFPIKYPVLYNHYQKQVGNFWTPEEICFQQDLVDWPTLTDNERHFIKMVLAFFAGSDGIVGENLAMMFYCDTDIPEARANYAFQNAMEQCHSITYSLLIDTYIKDIDERDYLFNALETIPAVGKKADWAMQWMSKDLPYVERLLGFVCVEGIQFSGSFCAIYYIKSKNKMPGLCFQNELIARDEGLHTEFGIDMYKLQCELGDTAVSVEKVHAMFDDAVRIEDEFITESLPCSLLGMSSSLMSEYIRYVADRLLVQLNYPKLYGAEQPFDFMENISLSRKTSFFEARVSEYQKSGVGDSTSGKGLTTINVDDDF